MLDLSAFDTIDHDILAKRLHDRFGIRSKVYDWLNICLHGRTQRVSIGSLLSRRQTLQFGVPQGYVLGPVLFSLHMDLLKYIITRHGFNCVIYADDCQPYISCGSRSNFSCVTQIKSCIDKICCWMQANMLALNDSKTEIVFVFLKLIHHIKPTPRYLSELIKSKSDGDQAFSAPTLWNQLSIHLRIITNFDIFKNHLKTFLYKRHYL